MNLGAQPPGGGGSVHGSQRAALVIGVRRSVNGKVLIGAVSVQVETQGVVLDIFHTDRRRPRCSRIRSFPVPTVSTSNIGSWLTVKSPTWKVYRRTSLVTVVSLDEGIADARRTIGMAFGVDVKHVGARFGEGPEGVIVGAGGDLIDVGVGIVGAPDDIKRAILDMEDKEIAPASCFGGVPRFPNGLKLILDLGAFSARFAGSGPQSPRVRRPAEKPRQKGGSRSVRRGVPSSSSSSQAGTTHTSAEAALVLRPASSGRRKS